MCGFSGASLGLLVVGLKYGGAGKCGDGCYGAYVVACGDGGGEAQGVEVEELACGHSGMGWAGVVSLIIAFTSALALSVASRSRWLRWLTALAMAPNISEGS